MPLSAVIITYNEERNIGRCLESLLGVADEIVVVDSFSSDNTESICSKYNVRFIQREWAGYSDTKNFANTQASHDWILSLDADEALSAELKQSVIDHKKHLSAAGFNRLTNYCGNWIRHSGWYPDFKVRIFDRRITQWSGTIHETLVSDPPQKVTRLNGDCLHYSYYSVEEHYRQAEKFSSLSAEHLYRKGKRTNVVAVLLRPALRFFRNYILKLGILDGAAGFTVCRISAYENKLKYSKLLELQRRSGLVKKQ